MSWREIESQLEHDPVLLIPMASTEEHGPHAPTGDYVNTDLITEQVATQTGALMTPVIPFGYSEYFRQYPGTIAVRPETLKMLVEDVLECAIDQGFHRIILVNGHNGNDAVLMPLVREIRRQRGLIVPIVASTGFGLTPELKRELYGDVPTGHGGEPMGSNVSYLRPELVDLDKPEEFGSHAFLGLKPSGLNGVEFQGRTVGMAINMEDIAPASGSLSDPRIASPEKEKELSITP